MADYDRHLSQPLLDLFKNQEFPHQGQEPGLAKIVIVGLDANYTPEISQSPDFFKYVLEYHQDGVSFWQKYGVHHPFLLKCYPFNKTTGGVPYHRKVAWMNLTPDHAKHISFIELLPVPTTGGTQEKRFWELFDVEHARRIDRLIETGAPRVVVLSKTLLTNYMLPAKRTRGVFAWLPDEFRLGEMKRIGDTIIYGAPHFSSMTSKQAFVDLGVFLRNYCDSNAA